MRNPYSGESGYEAILSALRTVMDAEEPSYGLISCNPERNYFIQFLSQDDEGFFHCEAVSNEFLEDPHKLDDAQEKTLRDWRFHQPTDELPNWHRRYRADGLEHIAYFLLRLLKEAYGYAGDELEVTIDKQPRPAATGDEEE
jgi:hypothetical protein